MAIKRVEVKGMRKEACKEEWKKLYDLATRIKELKPWEDFWDLDLICLREGEKEDSAFVSILGKGGECYGIVVYEGYWELNTFMMMLNQVPLNLSAEFVMGNQSNLSCYWGNRDELTDKERETIKEIGYKYRGKNQWLYFRSYKEGYYPYRFSQDEVHRMCYYLELLEEAILKYRSEGIEVNFQGGEMFVYSIDPETENRHWGAEELPFVSFSYRSLRLDDQEMEEELGKVPTNNYVLEMDIVYQAAKINDKSYERPGNVRMIAIAEARTGLIMKVQPLDPEDDQIAELANSCIDFIAKFGAPKEIRVGNVIVEAALEEICRITGTKLKRVKRLQAIDEFINGMEERMR